MGHYHEVKKLATLGANIAMVILVGIGCFCIYEGRIESVIFDRQHQSLEIRRTLPGCEKKMTWHRIDQVESIYIARQGIKKADMDMTHFVLIIRMHNGQR